VGQGLVNVPFSVYIPRVCVEAGANPCPIMNYGHGLLGTQDQAGGLPSDVANRFGYIVVAGTSRSLGPSQQRQPRRLTAPVGRMLPHARPAVDMWGMSSYDVPYLVLAMLDDLSDITTVPDRSHQGVLNHLVAVKLLKGNFANDTNVIFNGRSVIDTTTAYYWGISQGGILVRRRAAIGRPRWLDAH